MFFWGFQMPPPEKPAPEEEPETLDEELGYRLREFVNLGFDELAALALAWEKASPSEARELLKKGCPRKTAASILL